MITDSFQHFAIWVYVTCQKPPKESSWLCIWVGGRVLSQVRDGLCFCEFSGRRVEHRAFISPSSSGAASLNVLARGVALCLRLPHQALALRSLRRDKHILPLPTCSMVSLPSAGRHCSEPTWLSGDIYGVWECELQQNEQSNSSPLSVEESNFPGKFLQWAYPSCSCLIRTLKVCYGLQNSIVKSWEVFLACYNNLQRHSHGTRKLCQLLSTSEINDRLLCFSNCSIKVSESSLDAKNHSKQIESPL